MPSFQLHLETVYFTTNYLSNMLTDMLRVLLESESQTKTELEKKYT